MPTEIGIEGDSFHGVHQSNQSPTDTLTAPQPEAPKPEEPKDTEAKIISEPEMMGTPLKKVAKPVKRVAAPKRKPATEKPSRKVASSKKPAKAKRRH